MPAQVLGLFRPAVLLASTKRLRIASRQALVSGMKPWSVIYFSYATV